MSPEKTASWLEENKERIVSISDKIWELAELGLIEFESSKLLRDAEKARRKHGFHVERRVLGIPTAFIAA